MATPKDNFINDVESILGQIQEKKFDEALASIELQKELANECNRLIPVLEKMAYASNTGLSPEFKLNKIMKELGIEVAEKATTQPAVEKEPKKLAKEKGNDNTSGSKTVKPIVVKKVKSEETTEETTEPAMPVPVTPVDTTTETTKKPFWKKLFKID
jgi:hypothetical protein